MKLSEMKKKVLGLIEELNPQSPLLTEDPDIATKINDVTNQIMFEMIRFRKLPAYVEMVVKNGDVIDFEDIEKASKYAVYQIARVSGVPYDFKADGTVIKVLGYGVLEIEYYKYPDSITEKTKDSYEFEVPQDILEIMPYGIAADLLKSDVSSEYGRVYADNYENLKRTLDHRYVMPSISIKGGMRI